MDPEQSEESAREEDSAICFRSYLMISLLLKYKRMFPPRLDHHDQDLFENHWDENFMHSISHLSTLILLKAFKNTHQMMLT